jgi:hypothetical protein
LLSDVEDVQNDACLGLGVRPPVVLPGAGGGLLGVDVFVSGGQVGTQVVAEEQMFPLLCAAGLADVDVHFAGPAGKGPEVPVEFVAISLRGAHVSGTVDATAASISGTPKALDANYAVMADDSSVTALQWKEKPGCATPVSAGALILSAPGCTTRRARTGVRSGVRHLKSGHRLEE